MGTNPLTERSNTMAPQNQPALVMLRLAQVILRTGLSRSTIYSKLDSGSAHYDPTFPTQVRLGSGSAVRFIEAEVNAWLEQCVRSARSGKIKAVVPGTRSAGRREIEGPEVIA
ncbi:helix-turn-helix transcriptional regulator [Pseudomonas paeninsulae]|uniref:helix-turn-helix transcriptional regulator n=1 Tax=Pseudomonas paeninsulae TaxID=3110772 RepID=UPI002D76D9C6|nr:AlpA family phage regulatory protein [Pseudomonas sp. IT1137]